MKNNLYSNLVNFYNVNDENFKEFMAQIYKEMLLTHKDVQYVKEHLTEEIEKKLEIYLVDGKFNINIEEKVNEFLENNQEIEDINTKLNKNTNNIENITSQLGKIVGDMITKTNSDYIDIRWLGATPDTDCHDIIMSIINKGKTVYIPKGVWRTSPLTINTKFQIMGESFGYVNKYNTSVDYSVLAPFSNQSHLIEVEGIREESEDQIRIDNVVLSCVKTSPPLKLSNVT